MGIFKSIAKAVLPVAGSVFGGPIGGAIGSGLAAGIGSKGGWDAEDSFEANSALQREFAQHGIRWRVEDAKAAGVHPLYALGAGGAAAAPIAVMDSPRDDWSARMGQDVSRAVTAQMDPMQRQLQQAQLDVLKSEAAKNNALALAAIGSKEAVSSQPGQVPFPNVAQGPVDMTGFYNRAVIKPNEVTSMSDSGQGIAAGPAAPGMYLHMFGGAPVLLPGRDVSEALESIGESGVALAMTVKANVNHLGEEGAEEVLRRVVPGGDFFADVYRGSRRARDAVVAGAERVRDYLDRVRRDVRERDWKYRRGIPHDAEWTGRGPAPWNR